MGETGGFEWGAVLSLMEELWKGVEGGGVGWSGMKSLTPEIGTREKID